MTQWDLDTTEATMGSADVTWELDDLDVWGVDAHTEELNSISNFDFYRAMMHRDPVRSPPRSPERTEFNRSITHPETSVESLEIDPRSLEPPIEPGWHFSEPYDLVHLRNMKGSFSHWEEVYAEIHKSLSPGGWIEVADWDVSQTSFHGSSFRSLVDACHRWDQCLSTTPRMTQPRFLYQR
jgi:hypothetical protein